MAIEVLSRGSLPRQRIASPDLDAALRTQETEIRAGDVVLVRVGSDTEWVNPDRYLVYQASRGGRASRAPGEQPSREAIVAAMHAASTSAG